MNELSQWNSFVCRGLILLFLKECIQFMQPIFIEHLLCAKHYSRHLSYIDEQSKDPCPHGMYILSGNVIKWILVI